VDNATWRVAGVLLLIVLYTIIWYAWARPWLRTSVAFIFKRLKFDETTSKKLATYSTAVLNFLFFLSYIPLAATLVHYFGLWNHRIVEGGKFWAGIGLIAAYIFQSQFFGLTLGGLKVLLLRAMKKGDYCEYRSPKYGVVVAEGETVEIDTHGTKVRDEDGSIITIPNEITSALVIRNYDHDKFHHKVFEIALLHNETHEGLADRAINAIATLQHVAVMVGTEDDEKWWTKFIVKGRERGVSPYSVASKISARFTSSTVRVFVPVRRHLEAKDLEHELIKTFPELFGQRHLIKQRLSEATNQ